MGKFLKVLFCFIIVDFYFFSTKMYFTHGFNTKELMAVVGIFLFVSDLSRRRKMAISNEFLNLLLYSGIISLLAIFSAVFHNTQERAYTTYFMSMLVWLSASYVVARCLKAAHGKISVELLASYIVVVSVVQGLIAVIADNYAPLDNFVLTLVPGLRWAKMINRLYGLGDTASLDTGGIRFAIASLLCAHNIKAMANKEKFKYVPFYVLAFLIIAFTGNMVARTTLVGVVIGLAYLLFYINPFKTSLNSSIMKTWLWIIMETLAVVVILTGIYNTDNKFRERTRFAFEGFFSMAEEGHWRTGSNDKLATMIVFPDNAETWLIGDGYFVNPDADPYYLGESTEGYYMNTDVGYLRFIFFFGLIGLSVFCMYIIYSGRVCIRMHPGHTLFFIALTSINFVIWMKVATDCFFILCLFISLGYVINGEDTTEVIEE